jgi:hypothetical protein
MRSGDTHDRRESAFPIVRPSVALRRLWSPDGVKRQRRRQVDWCNRVFRPPQAPGVLHLAAPPPTPDRRSENKALTIGEPRGYTGDMAASDMLRRAPALAQHHLWADPRLLRKVLHEVDLSLGGVDSRARRKAVLLVASLVDHWTRGAPDPYDRIGLEIERSPIRVRITATGGGLSREFWETVGRATAAGLADSWGVDRRNHPGAWFEIATTPSATNGSGPRARDPLL